MASHGIAPAAGLEAKTVLLMSLVRTPCDAGSYAMITFMMLDAGTVGDGLASATSY